MIEVKFLGGWWLARNGVAKYECVDMRSAYALAELMNITSNEHDNARVQ